MCLGASPVFAQTICIGCPCTGSGPVATPLCLPVNGCPTAGQCVGGRVQCVIVTGTVACSECGASGTRQCSPSSAGTCQPLKARSETCNGCDDNKNGQVDEGLSGAACSAADGCSGLTACTNGASTCVKPRNSRRPCSTCGTGGTQACFDTGYGTCQPPTASAETCNSCDDNKNELVDEDLNGAACTMASGCSGVTQCGGSSLSCVFPTNTSSKKPCTDCGAGGYQTCFGSGTTLSSVSACRPATPRVERCDQCDDDADGSVVTAGGQPMVRDCPEVGGCSTSTCGFFGWGACTPPRTEQCNGLDDTCNGQIDEGTCHVTTGCACQPKKCGDVPCGSSQPDGCGGELNCSCCTPTTCAPGMCGQISDGCGGTLSCGNCKSGQICGLNDANQCSDCVNDCSATAGYPCCADGLATCAMACPPRE